MSGAASDWSPAIVAGLMSGTSLDGISAAVVRFTPAGSRIKPELLAYVSVPYTPGQRARLGAALTGVAPAEYCRLAFDLGEWLAAAAKQAISESGAARSEVAAIASHGQTVWHEAGHSTWQLGEAAMIAELLGVPVISDFRVADVAAGGQGAPLVSIADALLFASGSRWRGLQNIGGIGNVTVVPPGGELAGVRAFDTGPGVVLIDAVVRRLWPDLPYDSDGRLAAAGTPLPDVVVELLTHPYFAEEPPKSTGRELFTPAYATSFIEKCRAGGASDEDILATAVLLTARSIADSYRRFIPEPVDEVLVSGGGARNPALIAALGREISPRSLIPFEREYFDGEAKEAVAFALLGYLHLMRAPGNIPSATGARGPRVLGKYTPA
ncbi:MAG TPA: anhydro-N-acetylmuramic acid kinase [Gemmatimonadaceae bacterium]|nr:anhydro-N-acetylmuramic acid kinase [Gemmatimonadaceae bacterium]